MQNTIFLRYMSSVAGASWEEFSLKIASKHPIKEEQLFAFYC